MNQVHTTTRPHESKNAEEVGMDVRVHTQRTRAPREKSSGGRVHSSFLHFYALRSSSSRQNEKGNHATNKKRRDAGSSISLKTKTLKCSPLLCVVCMSAAHCKHPRSSIQLLMRGMTPRRMF